ncbi:arylsulfatase J-like [Ctenocephalides felis]|uniref:arylsulfatase J-like n=1 Tax=Ctenocephalides felis TaxID=7515 RepID=UPI000E6E1BD6|nr:arylsulfatase J-like [Ctenocephalides felis]
MIRFLHSLTLISFLISSFFICNSNGKRPNIIFILADDLGWNDVGFHGSSQIPTPNIDALAYSGVILHNYYVQPLCTPSRTAFMTGKYPIRTGMQHDVLYAGEARGLPLSERLFPQYLKDLGYTNRMLGKWHLGHYKKEYTPLYRGFDSHIGAWAGHHDYYDHTVSENSWFGLDMRRGLEAAWDLHGQYTTDVYSKEGVKIVENHNSSEPLFLYVAHTAVHSSNSYSPLPAPDNVVDSFNGIENYQRRRFAAILTKMDDAIGELVEALSKKDMLKDSIIIFSTDNGGAPAGFNLNAASNWPLRGVKYTLFEGAVRGAGLIWSPLIKKPQRVSNQRIHISDWMPTLFSAIGANISINNLDGMDLWISLSEDAPSPRSEILLNLDDRYKQAAVIDGRYKLMQGDIFNGGWNGWYGPSGRNITYNMDKILASKTRKALEKLGYAPTPDQITSLRKQADIDCPEIKPSTECNLKTGPCVFDLVADPCEQNNLAHSEPEILEKLQDLLATYNSSFIMPPSNLPIDPRSRPSLFDHTWSNFGDHNITLPL